MASNGLDQYLQRRDPGAPVDADLYVGPNTGELVRVDEQLDEALSALDPRLSERLRMQLRGIQRNLGITTIYVTHDQAEGLAVSDWVAVMESGHVERVGISETVYRVPARRFVAEFGGDSNVLDGHVVGSDPPTATVDGVRFALPERAALRECDGVTVSTVPRTSPWIRRGVPPPCWRRPSMPSSSSGTPTRSSAAGGGGRWW